MPLHRVAVTGLGAISALGPNREAFWENLVAGRSGIGPLTLADTGMEPSLLRFPNAAQVREYDSAAHFDPKEAGLLDHFAQFGAIAAREAVACAGVANLVDGNAAVVTGC